jgi:integrase/recombinase XerD
MAHTNTHAGERDAFLRAAELADRQVRTLCMTLAYAGCRLSKALALTADRVDLAAGVLVIESLKKRQRGIYRAVPVPPALLDALDLVHGIRERQGKRGKGHGDRLWPWSRMTGWRAVHAVMQAARLDGPHASPKGLRHGFGVAAGIPQPRAEMARPRPAHHHRHLRQRHRRRGTGHRTADVGVDRP